MIAFCSIGKRYSGVVVFQGASFNVSRGSCHGLMGENGTGNSRLRKILAGIRQPDEYATAHIRVNTIGCGPSIRRLPRAGTHKVSWPERAHPIGRIAQPEEIANFFVYMASDAASFFTGSVLMMDGGFTAQ